MLRRAWIGVTAGALVVLCDSAAGAPRAVSRVPRSPIRRENARVGTTAWLRAEEQDASVEGYTSRPSVLAGETVEFHIRTTPARRYRIVVYRIGWYGGAGGRRVACLPSCRGDEQGQAATAPPPDPVTGEVDAGWPVTDRLRTAPNWVSGYYIAWLVPTSGGAKRRDGRVFFVVRNQRPSRILVDVPVNTWQAYNNWGGKSLYNFNSTGNVAANHVSFNRPYGASLGFQSPFAWEIPFVRFLERRGYDVTYTTDVDIDARPTQLLQHRLVIAIGHGEYWSKSMRDAYDVALRAGRNLLFSGANDAYWQIRYDDDRRTIVEYKSVKDDPEPNPALKTALFRELTPPRYECALMGVQHQGGFRHTAEPPIAYTVAPGATSQPWFRSTGLASGDSLPDLVGREWDSIPGYTDACPHPGLRVLFHADDTWGPADAVTFRAPSGGRVFSSGSHQFVWGLDPLPSRLFDHPYGADPRLQRFMQNVLDDLGGPFAREAS